MTRVPSDTNAPGRAKNLLLVGAAAIMALYAGFVRFTPEECEKAVRAVGYWWMVALVLASGLAAAWAARESGGMRAALVRMWPGRWHAVGIVVVWLWLLHIDRPGYKIMYDEPVQMSTARALHAEREFATASRAYEVDSVFTVLSAYLDKRPPLFPFLVSIVHDITGYRILNAYLVNAAGTLALVVAVWLLGRRYGGSPGGGGCAVALLATLPVLGIAATSAGMDLINLAMLAAMWLATLFYIGRPTEARAALMIALALLLAYSRYESVLYVGSAAAAWAIGGWRRRRWDVPAVWALLPLSLVLYAWHNTVLSNSSHLWELNPGQTHRFSLDYVANNLAHAWRFLFAVGWSLPNSALIAGVGVAGGLVVAVIIARRRAALAFAEGAALAAVGGGVAVSFAMLMCYYWGELDDPIVSRLSLPLHLLLVVLGVAGWREIATMAPRFAGSWRPLAAAIAAVLISITVPAAARDRYKMGDLLQQKFAWQQRVVATFWPAPDLILSNDAPICWLAEAIPSISVSRARFRLDDLEWHLRRHSFRTVLVMQRLVAQGAAGGWAVDPVDALPERCRLEEVAVRRTGRTLSRVSRLVEIEAAEMLKPGS